METVDFKRDFSEDANILFEHQIEIAGNSYLLILGEHINGGFICVPNWGWSCEASCREGDVGYNTERLIAINVPEGVARTIAIYIDSWIGTNN